jgi:hypothetical protein
LDHFNAEFKADWGLEVVGWTKEKTFGFCGNQPSHPVQLWEGTLLDHMDGNLRLGSHLAQVLSTKPINNVHPQIITEWILLTLVGHHTDMSKYVDGCYWQSGPPYSIPNMADPQLALWDLALRPPNMRQHTPMQHLYATPTGIHSREDVYKRYSLPNRSTVILLKDIFTEDRQGHITLAPLATHTSLFENQGRDPDYLTAEQYLLAILPIKHSDWQFRKTR